MSPEDRIESGQLPGDTQRSGRRCFISAPADAVVAPLVQELVGQGWHPFLLSDVATLGASLAEAVQEAIRDAEVVIGLFAGDAMASANTAFEVGFAVALGKPVVLVVSPGTSIPSDLQSFLYVQAELDNVEAVVLALDNLDKYAQPIRPEQSRLSNSKPLGSYADQLMEEAGRLGSATERAFERVVTRAIEASGAVAVTSAGRNRGFDIGVWSDDLDAIGANPLLIELKRRVDRQTVRRTLTALHHTPTARVALVVSLDDTPSVDAASVRWPLLWISLSDLLTRMRSATFPEVVRDLRNRSVHGLTVDARH